ncbi:MAG TPA: 2Fe-2S iron-sulfur cluster-binding protein [Actinomycetota bacterium]
MPSIAFEGRRVEFEDGDTVGSALFRSGVRTFTRSVKHHRRRGLYCLTGDCASCLLTVDDRPGVRSCVTEAADGMRVRRESGWPSAERDLLAIADRAHALMPVGFYYKTFVRPRAAWPLAERLIRRATGVGRLPTNLRPAPAVSRTAHADVLVIGGGIAGVAAARAAAGRGETVLLAEERRIGDALLPGPDRASLAALAEEVGSMPGVTLLERHAAIGIYDGPIVPLAAPAEVVRVRTGRVVVATGAVEAHPIFPGNDVPGVFLSRGAARLAAIHRIRPGERAVAVIDSREGLDALESMIGAGLRPAVVTALALSDEIRSAAAVVVRDGRIVRVEGRRWVRAVEIDSPAGRRRIECDALVVAPGTVPRDDLLRMSAGLPVVGAGEVVLPGCTPEDAARSGAAAGIGEGDAPRAAGSVPGSGDGRSQGRDGYLCPCEDVSLHDLERAWAEGWRSAEILKRYTTATMGPCRGALCGRHLAAFCARADGPAEAQTLTTARPPVRPVALEDLAAGVHESVERRTSLHHQHLAAGGVVGWSGSWMRPYRYGDVLDEYRAVRERASVMDVGTLGKFLVAGRDAAALLDAVFATRIADLGPGRCRYVIALDEAGYVTDDGVVAALEDGRLALTSTSSGADRMEARLRDRVERLDLHVHFVNQTPMLGAINLAGPRARDVLERLTDDRVGADVLPHLAHAAITVAGVPCRAMRVGFVGEASFELHHPRARGAELWDALLRSGRDLGLRPHGLDALDVLRLEKGHVYLGQDTLPDDHPWKLGLGWAVSMDKGEFLGRTALERMRALPLERRLVGLAFDANPERGVPLSTDGRIVGRVTSCAWSPVLDRSIGLGWLRAVDGTFPQRLRAGAVAASVVDRPFYDPRGARLRA